MASTSVSPSRREKILGRDGFLAPAVYAAMAIAIFAVVTQLLAWTNAISLSTTLLTMWLVVLGLIVLLAIAHIACRAYVITHSAQAVTGAEKAKAAAEWGTGDTNQAHAAALDAEHQKGHAQKADSKGENGSAEDDEDAWVPPAELRHLDGTDRSVSTAEVFPHGCYLEPGSIEAQDYDEKTGTQGTVVELTRPRARVYQCKVVDLNPALKDRSHETVVILEQKPSLPPGARYPLVEFDDLMITPSVTDRSRIRMGFTLHATGIRPAAGQAKTA